MAHHRGFRRVVTEKAIDQASRRARDRIMARFTSLRAVAVYVDDATLRRLRRSIFHEIGDCVRLKSRLERR